VRRHAVAPKERGGQLLFQALPATQVKSKAI
jgi:hypothetical protein